MHGCVPSVSPHHPDFTSKHRLGHWKCEEFMKFALVAPYGCNCVVPTVYSYARHQEICGHQFKPAK